MVPSKSLHGAWKELETKKNVEEKKVYYLIILPCPVEYEVSTGRNDLMYILSTNFRNFLQELDEMK